MALATMIGVTDSAARQLRELLADRKDAAGEVGLRLTVQRGGCAGLQYAMKLAAAEAGDEVVSHGGVSFIIEAQSIPYLRGCRIDYVEALNDSGFRISNPNAVRSCGCGTSFEPAADGPGTAIAPVPDGEACASEIHS